MAHIIRLRTIGATAAASGLIMLACCGATRSPARAAAIPPTFRLLQLSVLNLPPGDVFRAVYDEGVDHSSGGSTIAQSGVINFVAMQSSTAFLVGAGTEPLEAIMNWALWVDGTAVTGNATIPQGVIVYASLGGTTVSLSNGHFSIPTGLGKAGARAPRTPLSVRCRASGRSCRAVVPIAGGASNRELTVNLPSAGLRLRLISVSPRVSRGAYSLTRGRYRAGGRRWVAILNAVSANPRGAHLTLTFDRARLGCTIFDPRNC